MAQDPYMAPALVKEPIYYQLHQALRQLIHDEALLPGGKFLTERVIAERFGVSRATANKCLAGLVGEGLLEFRKGLGTFVKPVPLGYDLNRLISFTEKARAAGVEPETRVLKFTERLASGLPADVRARLQLSGRQLVLDVMRLRLAGGKPVILERRYLVRRRCSSLTRHDLAGSLYQALTLKCHLEIAGADQTIRAIAVAPADARLLGVAPGTPALSANAIGHLEDQTPIWWEHTIYRGDVYEFHTQLGGIRDARCAVGRLRLGDAAGRQGASS
jgi:GntR family transcriptional regulator